MSVGLPDKEMGMKKQMLKYFLHTLDIPLQLQVLLIQPAC